MQDRGGVVEQALRHGQHRLPAVQPDGVTVHLFDGAVGPELGAHHRLAGGVLLARVVGDHQEGAEQADDRGAGLLVEPAREVPDDMIGSELIAVRPFDPLLQVERPGLEVVARRPFLEQPGAGDVIGAGAGQEIADLADDIRAVIRVRGRRIVDLGHAHGEGDRAARGGRLGRRHGLGNSRQGIGRRRRETQQGREPQEIAARQPAIPELVAPAPAVPHGSVRDLDCSTTFLPPSRLSA